MATLQRTALHARHVALGAQMVGFGGWDMPVQYPGGILKEHLATRRHAGLFDVSHMGRFIISGQGALPFLQHVLTNNAAALEVDQSHYTILADASGGAIDDAYLYRFEEDNFLLVVNASNKQKDWEHLQGLRTEFSDVTLEDRTQTLAMLSLQGPQSKVILGDLLKGQALPEPQRNALCTVQWQGHALQLARTGYTGEPLCFELFVPVEGAFDLWDQLIESEAQPVGLGARDTLRLEAGLPLYGHELGDDPHGNPIPIFALDLARVAVSFSPLKGDFLGKTALQTQFNAFSAIIKEQAADIRALPRRIRPFELLDKGIARRGAPLFYHGQPVGVITSGTMVPLWQFEGLGIEAIISDQSKRRAIGLALMDSRIPDGAELFIEVRGKQLKAGVMPYLLRSEAPPMARPITWQDYGPTRLEATRERPDSQQVRHWVQKAVDNTIWRQQHCINLIPSEQTPSALVRLLTIMDPAGRYAEHKPVKAFADAEVFYYQGTEFIAAVEQALAEQMALFLSCRQVETRPISGQMANMVVFSALVDHLNRTDRKAEQRRIRKVMNHHIINGGHLSAQPMGALRDYVMRDPQSERAAVINFPVLSHNPYQVDTNACADLLQQHRPELMILGKSMVLHKEPVAEMRRLIDELGLDTVLMYDMAHVLGLAGPHFQHPFDEGADLVTGSTHKTFFGTQRGIVAADFGDDDRLDLWEAINRRAFPGSVSNHHLGTLLGLLVAAMEVNAFKEPYQRQVIANAKAFANALDDCGLQVAGDRSMNFTETHQVIVQVGYAQGPAIARALEASNIICNYQATPQEEGFTASGALRMGVAEMTRFGMLENGFQTLAALMADVILNQKNVASEVITLRKKYSQMQFCFSGDDMASLMSTLHALI
jgi:aminomethyltransferase